MIIGTIIGSIYFIFSNEGEENGPKGVNLKIEDIFIQYSISTRSGTIDLYISNEGDEIAQSKNITIKIYYYEEENMTYNWEGGDIKPGVTLTCEYGFPLRTIDRISVSVFYREEFQQGHSILL